MSTRRFVPTTPWLHALECPGCSCHSLLVVEDAERIIGWCRTFPGVDLHSFRCANLGIGLLPEYRSRGIGSTLVMQSLAWARSVDYDRVTLTVHPENARAIRVFSRCGFGFIRQSEELLIEMACNL